MLALFAGVVAKSRILEMGSDIINCLAAELLPRLHNLELLFSEPFTEVSRVAVAEECHFITSNFTPDKIIKRRHGKQQKNKRRPETNKVPTSPASKTENLLSEFGQEDMELLQNVVLATEQWQLFSATAEVCVLQLRAFIDQCQGILP
jgi:hypothetical protein